MLAAILGFFYSVGVYFTYFSEPEKFLESVDNSKRIENIKIEAIERAKLMNQSNQDFQGAVENQAFKDLKAKKIKNRQDAGKHLD